MEIPLQKRLKAEANRIEVSLATLLLTAIHWWLNSEEN
nr:hypothetical protein [Cupriavidus gilardii]